MQQRHPDPHEPSGSPQLPLTRRHSRAFGPPPQRTAQDGPVRRRPYKAERGIEVEARLRTVAHQSRVPAPPSLTAAVQRSLARAEISSDPDPKSVRRIVPWHLLALQSAPLTDIRHRDHAVWARHPRLALTGAGTVIVALLCGLGFALDPGEGLAALGLAGAILLSTLALAHLLSIAVGAILGDALLAGLAGAVYVALTLLWVQLVRRPVEA